MQHETRSRAAPRLAVPDVQAATTTRLAAGFDALPADATESLLEGFVTDFVGVLAPLLAELRDEPGVAFLDEAQATSLLDAYQAEALNPAQGEVLKRLTDRLG